jgi:hypothetical protein
LYWFSAIYKLTLESGIRYIAYDLPERFPTATDALRFAERWNPNPALVEALTPLEVCQRRLKPARLNRYLRQTPKCATLV